MKKVTKHKVEGAVAITAGIAAATIAAALLLGHDGKKNRKDLKNWSIKMKKEVVAKAKKIKTVSAPVYKEIVDQVAKGYVGIKDIDKADLKREVNILKKEWNKVVKVSKKSKKSKKTTKK